MNNSKSSCTAPMISFIVTCYNIPEEMIKECLNSILELSLRQTEKEIIVVDDGSKNCLMSSLMEYSDKIIYVRQKNEGLSAARNTGLRIATGQYIQFVDGDDKLIPEGYERCIDIVRYRKPDMVLFDSSDKDESGNKYGIPESVDGTEYMRHTNIHATACGYVFSRKILMDLRFTPGILHEDEEFTPQLLLRAENVYATDFIAYFYRKRPFSITRSKDKRSIIKRLNDVERIIFHLQEIAESMPVKDSLALQRRVAQLTMDYIYNIITLARSSKQLNMRIKRLEEKGLFPLPDRSYTKKYSLFRTLIKNKMARKMISAFLK